MKALAYTHDLLSTPFDALQRLNRQKTSTTPFSTYDGRRHEIHRITPTMQSQKRTYQQQINSHHCDGHAKRIQNRSPRGVRSRPSSGSPDESIIRNRTTPEVDEEPFRAGSIRHGPAANNANTANGPLIPSVADDEGQPRHVQKKESNLVYCNYSKQKHLRCRDVSYGYF